MPLHVEWKQRNGWQDYDPQGNLTKPEGRRVTLVIVDAITKCLRLGGLSQFLTVLEVAISDQDACQFDSW